MKKGASRRNGYSLVELMLVVAILGVVSSVGPLLMSQLENFYLMTTARNEIERDARSALDTVNRHLRQAVGDTIVISTPPSQAPYSKIAFNHVDGRGMSFYQSGGKLMMSVNGNDSILTRNLIYIAFTFPQSDDPTIVSVSVTMGKSIQLGRRKVLELTIQKVRIMN